jgi:hypothetical protein
MQLHLRKRIRVPVALRVLARPENGDSDPAKALQTGSDNILDCFACHRLSFFGRSFQFFVTLVGPGTWLVDDSYNMPGVVRAN